MLVGTVCALAVTDSEKHINRLIRSEITLRITTTSSLTGTTNFPFLYCKQNKTLFVTHFLRFFWQIDDFCRICQINYLFFV